VNTPTVRDPAWAVPKAQLRLAGMLRPMLRRWLRLTVEGAELVPADGALLLAPTHRSHADSAAIGTALPRPIHYLGDVKLLSWPIVGRTLPSFGMVPLRRGEADGGAIDELATFLTDSGACVVIYPEGTRSRDGRVHRLRSGLSRVAARAHVPVVPVAVVGSERAWPIGRPPRLRGGATSVRFGAPIDPPADDPRSRRTFNEHLQRVLAELAGTTTSSDLAPIRGGADPDRSGT
jgi:1-acyl-sn-glycerol-3-phosphate acyltransferase